MIDIALAAVAIISMAVAATVIAMDRDAVKRHVDDHGANHDEAARPCNEL